MCPLSLLTNITVVVPSLCECSLDCQLYGTCCIDFNITSPPSTLPDHECVSQYTDPTLQSFYAIVSCPVDYPNSVLVDLCETPIKPLGATPGNKILFSAQFNSRTQSLSHSFDDQPHGYLMLLCFIYKHIDVSMGFSFSLMFWERQWFEQSFSSCTCITF